ncbi:MAG: 50S ribosomal protein L11 methyltransferase [Bacteroidia bacterium]
MFEKTDYICLRIDADESRQETLMAWLGTLGFEAFEEGQDMLKAYTPVPSYDQAATKSILQSQGASFSEEVIKARNWNADWEASYESVEIDDFCQIVPSFHTPKENFAHTIHLDPKMSFGTGHHETTRLMARQMKDMDFVGKTVLDMGCGTGVLGILALKLGSASVLGIDIDAWSAENGMENARRNGVDMPIALGDVRTIPADAQYDVILANINRNVLLQDVAAYAKALKPGGKLLASGFLTTDLDLITKTFKESGLQPGKLIQENNWLSLCFDTAIAQ